MTSLDAAALTPAELVHALRVGAQHDNRIEAAIELLSRHEVWLRRSAFLATCVRVTAQADADAERLAATVDWHKAVRLAERVAATTTDRRMLRVAAALSGDQRRVDILARQHRCLGIGTDSVEHSPGISDGRQG